MRRRKRIRRESFNVGRVLALNNSPARASSYGQKPKSFTTLPLEKWWVMYGAVCLGPLIAWQEGH
jgi:hypothetical protein